MNIRRTLWNRWPRLEVLEDRWLPAAIPSLVGFASLRPLLGESVTFDGTFINSGDAIGFGPVLDLAIDTSGPDGASSSPSDGYGSPRVTVAGTTLVPTTSIVLTAGQTTYTNPLTNQTVSIPVGFGVGDTINVYALPFSNLTAGQSTTVSIAASTSNLADVGSPLPICLTPRFRDDEPALNGPAITGSAIKTDATPVLWRMTKTYLDLENETATGPNYARDYRLDLDIATGQKIDNTTLIDVLSPTMQYVRVVNGSVQGVAVNPTLTQTPSRSTPGGTLAANFGTVTGKDGTDVSFTFKFYVPRDRTDGSAVLPQGSTADTGTNSILETNRSSANGTWTPIDTRDPLQTVTIALDTPGTTHTLQEHSLAVQKSFALFDTLSGAPISNTRTDALQPGQTLVRYSIDFQVSDYYAFQNLTVNDLLSDGQRLYLGTLPAGLGSSVPRLKVNNAFVQGTPATRQTTDAVFSRAGVIAYRRNFSTTNPSANPTSYNPNTGPAASIFSNLTGSTINGTTELTFDVSAELVQRGLSGRLVGSDIPNGGGAPQNNNPFAPTPTQTVSAGPVSGTITFWAEVRENFSDDFPSGNPAIGQGDKLQNTIPQIRGDQIATTTVNSATPTVIGLGSDDSITSFVIPYGSAIKTVYAINGTLLPTSGADRPQSIQAGDRVTYKLSYTLPISSYERLRITDFPPLPTIPVGQAAAYDFEGNSPSYGAYTVAIAPDDTFFGTLNILNPVSIQAATTGAITATYAGTPSNGRLTGAGLPTVVDGVTLTVGNRVLVKDQTDAAQNGIYFVDSATQWTRDASFDTVFEVANASLFTVNGGTVNGGRAFVQANQAFVSFNGTGLGSVIDFEPFVTTDIAMNGVSFDFAAFADAGNYRNTTISLLLTLPVSNQALSSDLSLANRMRVDEGSTNQGSVSVENTSPLRLVRPVINVYKGVVGDSRVGGYTLTSSLGSTTFNGPGGAVAFSGPALYSPAQAAAIGASNATGLDAGDRVRFAIVVNNNGKGDAFDVTLSDTLPAGFTIPNTAAAFSSAVNLGVLRGDGSAIANGQLVDGTVRLATTDNLAGFSSNSITGVPLSLEGLALRLNDLVLVRGQTIASQNGVYTVVSFSATSATLTRVAASTQANYRVAVQGGTTFANTFFTNDGTGTWANGGTGAGYFFTYEVTNRRFTLLLNDNYTAGNTTAETLDNRAGGVSRGLSGTTDANGNEVSIPVTNGSNTVVVVYDLTLTPSPAPTPPASNRPVNASEQLTNVATVTNVGNSDGSDNLGTTTDNATVTIASPTVTKTLVRTSIEDASNAREQVVIGEVATYQVVLSIPEGITSNFQLLDSLPSGLALRQINSVTYAAGVSSTLTPSATLGGTLTNVVLLGFSGVQFNFGTITNINNGSGASTNNTITIVYEVVTTNVDTNQTDTTLTNAAQARYNIAGGASGLLTNLSQATTLTVIEPLINTTKSYTITGLGANSGDGNSNGIGQASNTVTYTVALSNPTQNGRNTTTAYDFTLSDPLPTTFINFGSGVTYTGPSRYSNTNFRIINNVLQTTDALGNPASLPSLLPGEAITLTVVGIVRETVVPEQLLSNTARTRWTSLTGSPGQLSAYNPDSTERTGNPNDPGATLNDYETTNTATFSIFTPTPVKSLVATSEPGTPGNNVAIGEIARYRLQVQIPRATINLLELRDVLPAGLVYIGNTRLAFVGTDVNAFSLPPALVGSAVTGNGLNIASVTPTFALPSANVTGGTGPGGSFLDGDDPAFILGTITNNNTSGNANAAEFVVIEFNALVLNIAANQTGTTFDNSFQTFINSNPSGPVSNTVTTTVIEPNVSIAKAVSIRGGAFGSTATGDAGDPVAYRFTLTNTGNATAFNTVITDNIPAVVRATLAGGNFAQANLSVTGGGFTSANFTTTNNVLSTQPGGIDIPANTTVTVTLTGVLTQAIAPTAVTINTVSLAYSSISGTGTNPNPTGGITPGAPGSSTGERDNSGGINDYSGSASATLNVPNGSLVKSLASTSLTGTTTNNVAIGERATYALAVTLPEGTATNLVLTDVLPVGLGYVPGSVVVDSTGFGGNTGAAPAVNYDLATRTLTITLASVVTTGDNVATNNTFVVRYDALVLDLPTNTGTPGAQTTLANSANLKIGSSPDVPTPPVVITVVEPRLAIVKTLVNSDTSVDAGTSMTYRFTISNLAVNGSTGPAYNLRLSDNLDARGLALVAGSVTISNNPGYVTLADSSTALALDAVLSELRLGDSVTLQVVATVKGPAASGTVGAPGSTVTNTARLNYDTAPTNGRPETPIDTNLVSFTINTNSIAGQTYRDSNNNGIYEPGLGETLVTGQNISYRLTGVDAQGNAVDLTQTTNTGTYAFSSLRPGTYAISQTTQPTGLVDGRDTAGTPFGGTNSKPIKTGGVAGLVANVVIPANTPQDGTANVGINYNFGELAGATIGDFVWNDLNSNGRQDAGEPGIAGIAVTLSGTDAFGNTVANSTTTDANGLYTFAGLFPGSYRVTFGRTAGGTTYTFTTPNAPGTTPDNSSKADPTTGATPVVTLLPGQTNLDLDAGLLPGGRIGDTVFYDVNGNGTQDANEPGIPGVTVTLATALNPNTPITTATTDANGKYLFANVVPGSYVVGVVVSSIRNGLTANTTPTSQPSSVTPGGTDFDRDFGFRGTGTLGDLVWLDANANGLFDSGEPGIPAVEMNLTWLGFDGVAGGGDDVSYPSTTTSNTGLYLFSNLPSGRFVASVNGGTLPSNALPTFDLDGIGTPNTASRTLGIGENARDVDFGYRGQAGVGDRVWSDLNGNGVQDAGEPGIVGAAMQLVTPGPDGVLNTADDMRFTTTTGTDGIYTFANVPVYGPSDMVTVNVTSRPAGFSNLTYDLDGIATPNTATAELGATQVRTDFDFGYQQPVANRVSLAGLVYVDRNNNGLREADEIGIPGVTVHLTGTTTTGRRVSATVVTDKQGSFLINELPVGTYTLREVHPIEFLDGRDRAGTAGGVVGNDVISNIVLTGTPPVATGYLFGERGLDPTRVSKAQFLASTQTILNRPAGSGVATANLAGTLGGCVYVDANNNGVRDGTESGIAGVTIILSGVTTDGRTYTETKKTDASGFFTFENVWVGVYQIAQVQPAGYRNGRMTLGSLGGVITLNVFKQITVKSDDNGIGYAFGEQ